MDKDINLDQKNQIAKCDQQMIRKLCNIKCMCLPFVLMTDAPLLERTSQIRTVLSPLAVAKRSGS